MNKITKRVSRMNKSRFWRIIYGVLLLFSGRQDILRVCRTNRMIDKILIKIMLGPRPKIEISEFSINLTTSNYRFNAWNANKYYGWLFQGSYKNSSCEVEYSWRDEIPSRAIAEMFRRYLTILQTEEMFNDQN